ncbi:hypothetical protein SM930_19015 [Escherichia coli]|uniref:hypothetical protein n=1 Tax=Escherichia coli TaxID=562 RepID=UPI002033F8BC|nr:hypothetical protein [Escherichia coli]MDZ9623807.1 hypothetical protein [Escherichia coli]MDZ9969000.1 hypothetical protein [Escherichia coli]
MKKKDIRFAISINSNLSKIELMEKIKNIIPGLIEITSSALREEKNMVVIEENDLYNPMKAEGVDGWMYYKFILSIFPLKGVETTLEYQRELSFLKENKRCGPVR